MKRTLLATLLLAFGLSAMAAQDSASLLESARAGKSAAALALLRAGTEVHAVSPNGTTALHWAAHHGDADLVRALLQAGAAADVANDFGATPIAEAALSGDVSVLRLLLEAGVPADTPNREGQMPLMVTARGGHLDAARLLLQHGAAVDAAEHWGGQSALMWATAQQQPAMIALLLEHGADPNRRGAARDWQRRVTSEPRKKIMHDGGLAPLHYAAREGCLDCLAPLIAGGADLDITDPDRVTPLNLAIMNAHFDVAAALVEGGADVNKWDFAGRTPLYNAVDMHTPPNTARYAMLDGGTTGALALILQLISVGADVNIQLKHRPQYRDRVNERGADIMLSVGATPLLRAARAGDSEIVELLLDHGALAELPNMFGVTPLMVAAGVGFGVRATRGQDASQADRLATLRLLLDAGADINRRTLSRGRVAPPGEDNFLMRIRITTGNQNYLYSYVPPDGRAAIHGAARNGWNEVVDFLVQNGALLKLAGRDGLTPLDLAAGRYEPEILVPPADPHTETMALLERLCAAQAQCGGFDAAE